MGFCWLVEELKPMEKQQTEGQKQAWWRLGLGGFLLVMMLGLMWPAFERGLARRPVLNLQTPDDGLEGTLLHESQLIRRDRSLYRPIVAEEFISAPYTPLHPMLLSFMPFDPERPFTAGRWISLLSMLAIGLIISLFVASHTRIWLLGLAVGACWLAFPPAQLWALRLKPDLFALSFTALGLLLASWREGRWFGWAAVCFGLAFLAKQTLAMAPLAVGLNLLLHDWRKGLKFGTLAVLAAGLPYLALDLVTAGWATRHIWGLHRSEWWSFDLMWKYVRLLGWSLPLVGLALLGLGLYWRHYAMRQAALYATLAPISLYGAGEVGAHHNHLLETMLAWCLAGGLAAGLLINLGLSKQGWRRAATALAIGGLLLQGWCLRQTPSWYGGEFGILDLARFVPYIQSKPGDVLLDNPGLAIAAGKPLIFDDPSTMGPAIESGVWPAHGFYESIRQRRWSLIMLPFNVQTDRRDATGRWTEESIRLIDEHYQLEFADIVFTYVPKP
ncbi:MAG TPA: hypothetical protein DEF47_24670 [Herpetosiphon sp.]|uniref:Glycosyltransferase RgtA/B/C/D-like domain-containing protein n=2 Tax=Herpetosiphon TaxID=64 RepID=A9B4V6_HERA2|nr:hypothetical protein Haur_3041 [Herpetosiphon aurantiacus DSM 785]HBW53089.1 hypothetical protein [Herpetosiphon sp.]